MPNKLALSRTSDPRPSGRRTTPASAVKPASAATSASA